MPEETPHQKIFKWERLNVLLNLYKVPEKKVLPLKEISSIAGYNPDNGVLYRLKEWLIKEKILTPQGKVRLSTWFGGGRTEAEGFVVSHRKIDVVLCVKYPTKIIYDRLLDGSIPILPRLKEDD